MKRLTKEQSNRLCNNTQFYNNRAKFPKDTSEVTQRICELLEVPEHVDLIILDTPSCIYETDVWVYDLSVETVRTSRLLEPGEDAAAAIVDAIQREIDADLISLREGCTYVYAIHTAATEQSPLHDGRKAWTFRRARVGKSNDGTVSVRSAFCSMSLAPV